MALVRASARRAARAVELHRADREDARAAISASSRPRSSIRSPRPARRRAHGVRRTTSSRRAASTRWPRAYAALYPAAEPAGHGRATTSPTSSGPTTTTPGMGRVDHNFTSANRLFVTGYWNKRQEDRYNWAQDAINATDGGVINGFAVTQGLRLPHQHRRDRRLHLGAVADDCCSTSARAGRGSASTAIRRRTSIRRRSGSRRPPLQLMDGYQYLPLFTFGAFSTTNENSTIASLGSRRVRLGRRVRPADGHLLGRSRR